MRLWGRILRPPREVDFTHSSVLWLNRKNLFWGTICLIVVDALVFTLPYLIKLAVDALQHKALPTWVPNFFAGLPTLPFLFSLCAIYVSISALIAYGRHWWRIFLIWSTFSWFHQMRDKFFRHIQGLDRGFFVGAKVGDLISALTTDTENMRMMVAIGGLMAIDATINFILFPILLWHLNSSLTLIVVPPLIVISILAVILSSRLEAGYMKIQELTAELSGRAFEMCSGVRVIKAFRKEKAIHDEFVQRSKELRDESIKVAKYQSMFLPGLDFALGLALCFSLIYGGLRVIQGVMPLSNLVAFQLYLSHMDWPMMCIGWFIQMYRQSRASQRRIQNFADYKNPLVSKAQGPVERSTSNSLFELRDLTLGHSNRREILFKNLSLKIPEKKWIGLTGSVGSGKSTLLELLSRQRDPDSGDILFRGRDLRSISYETVPNEILYVPQEGFLFSKSIRRNLLLGKGQRSEEELWTLLKNLCFDEDLLHERGGLDARLGERGTNLSGGQKQRLSLGRSLLKESAVYLLDDLFSHVDAETEKRLIGYLKERFVGAEAVLMVSQRLETLSQCEHLIVLDEGRVEFSGVPEQAFSQSSFLIRLRELQDIERGLQETVLI